MVDRAVPTVGEPEGPSEALVAKLRAFVEKGEAPPVTRRTITVEVWREDYYDCKVDGVLVTEHVAFLNEKLDLVPPEHRDVTKITIESEYDSCKVVARVFYERAETDEEVAARQRAETVSARRWIAGDLEQLLTIRARNPELFKAVMDGRAPS